MRHVVHYVGCREHCFPWSRKWAFVVHLLKHGPCVTALLSVKTEGQEEEPSAVHSDHQICTRALLSESAPPLAGSLAYLSTCPSSQ